MISGNLASELAEKTAGLLRLVDAPLSGTHEPLSVATCPSWSAPRQVSIGTRCPYWSCSGPAYASAVWAAPRLPTLASSTSSRLPPWRVSEAAVIAERAGLDLSRVLHSWELSLAGSRVLGAARAKLLNRDFEPDLPAGAALAPLEIAAQQAWRTGTSARLLANVRELFQLLDRAGLSKSGPDVHLPVPSRTTPRAPGSTGLLPRRRGVTSVEDGPGRAATCTRRRPGVLRSGELKNHYHQNDDDEDTDNGSDNSSVHGQDLLSGLRGTRMLLA